MRFCLDCGAVTEHGNRCAEHARAPGSPAAVRAARTQTSGRSRAEWQRVRRYVLDRDGHTCQACGDEDDLTVDDPTQTHRWSAVDGMQTLCRRCHGRLESQRHNPPR
jgi:5-methylcytosine-specific restriction endonuclease McrA